MTAHDPATSITITPTMRQLIENVIDDLLLLLDEIDGDADLEDDDREQDNSDNEPWLGWPAHCEMGPTFDPDRELDPAEMGICDLDAAAEQGFHYFGRAL